MHFIKFLWRFSTCSLHLKFSLIKIRFSVFISKSTASRDYHSRWSAAERHGVYHLLSTGKHTCWGGCSSLTESSNACNKSKGPVLIWMGCLTVIHTISNCVADPHCATDPVFMTRPYPEPEHSGSLPGPRSPDDLWPRHGVKVIRRTGRRGRGVCRNPHVQRNHYLFSRKCSI